MNHITHFKCPNCGLPLKPTGRSYQCDNKHSFDIAKEGYVNLLLAQNKKSKNPGDNKEMMQCRQSFLNAGHYNGLIEAIADQLTTDKALLESPQKILDIGCGEGFYLSALKQLIPLNAHGLDIAKEGVRLAAKRKCFDSLCVASAHHLPYIDESFDIAINVFSPLAEQEIKRCLRPRGKLITVSPSTHHLQGLAELIYDTFKPHTITPLLQEKHWELIDEHVFESTLSLQGEEIFQLLTMTPYYWSCSQNKQKALKEAIEMKTPIEFLIRTYQKH